MASITLEGNPIHTNGELPALNSIAPPFSLVDKDLNDIELASFSGQKKLLNIVPSLDTGVCAASTRKFNELVSGRDDITVLIISADLPFAQARFCSAENIDRVIALSMMCDKTFARDYGILISDGPLAGICARAVLVLDEQDRVIHSQLVPEIAQEPDYDSAMAALK